MTNKKAFATRIDVDLLKRMKHYAIDAERSLASLVEEAIQDFLEKHDKAKD